MRVAILALAVWALAGPAFALEPEDVLGEWITEWGNQGGEPVSGGAPMRVTLDSPGALDGVWPSPGADGVIYGEAVARPDGTLVWEGDWASIWPEGVTRGAFRFVFTDADSFTGTWSTDDGEIVDAPWNGRRAE
ncbi:MAG: hypothetical protein NW206_17505 [Hyphomonadaceae bacterium]|nr:hypothetical protein [Hyphomonadaceae bacterium]